MRKQQPITARLLEALKSIGPMTVEEAALFLGEDEHSVSAAALRLRTKRQRTPRQVRISEWVFESPGRLSRWRPVYAAGTAADAPKPRAMTSAETMRRCVGKQPQRFCKAPASIWHFAQLAASAA